MEANLSVTAASAINQAQVRNDAAAAIAKKTMDVQKLHGQAAVDLIKQVEQLTNQLAAGHLDVVV